MKLRVMIVLAAMAAMSTATASAAPTPGGAADSAPRAQVKALTSAATSIPFTAEYDAEAYYGPVRCTGKHEVNPKAYPGLSRDVERCTSTSPPLLTVVAGEMGEWFPSASGWDSDYDGAAAFQASYTVNSKARAFKIVAYYVE